MRTRLSTLSAYRVDWERNSGHVSAGTLVANLDLACRRSAVAAAEEQLAAIFVVQRRELYKDTYDLPDKLMGEVAVSS